MHEDADGGLTCRDADCLRELFEEVEVVVGLAFAEAVEASYPGYYARFVGGAIFFIGMCVMAYNVYMTTQQKDRDEAPAQATPLVTA